MIKKIRFSIICLFSLLLIFASSCATIQTVSHDQGKHKGWYKNPNNPHNPNTTKEKPKPGKPVKEKDKK